MLPGSSARLTTQQCSHKLSVGGLTILLSASPAKSCRTCAGYLRQTISGTAALPCTKTPGLWCIQQQGPHPPSAQRPGQACSGCSRAGHHQTPAAALATGCGHGWGWRLSAFQKRHSMTCPRCSRGVRTLHCADWRPTLPQTGALPQVARDPALPAAPPNMSDQQVLCFSLATGGHCAHCPSLAMHP